MTDQSTNTEILDQDITDEVLINLVDVEVDVNGGYPDFCDSFVTYAYCKLWDRELTEGELDELNECHSDFVYEKALNSFI